MLVLSRKFGEKIRIGPNITVTVVDIRGDKIRLGIDAPRDVAVDREEVFQQKGEHARGKAAAQAERTEAGQAAVRPAP
jgi:carbon storage regulator